MAQHGVQASAWKSDPEFRAEYERTYPFELFADAILGLRADLGWTQQELADRIGSSQPVIARAESGAHDFRISLLKRVGDAAGGSWRVTFMPESWGQLDTLSNVIRLPESVAYRLEPVREPDHLPDTNLALIANG